MKRYFLFDLDGTLTDTGEGIMKSAQYALDDFGIRNEPESRLRRFVGPPLDWSFRELYGLSAEDARKAVEKYRERYRTKGVYESPLYPGVEGFLARLSQKAEVCLATAKPLIFAEQILNMRDVRQYFTVVVGANLDGTLIDKAEIIAEVLRQLGGPPKEQALMIGDRSNDILGARRAGVESLGVEYGYSEPGELQNAGADHIVPTVAALEEFCLRQTDREEK